jgi:hypothetical protein
VAREPVPSLPLAARPLLEALLRHGVEFVVVGGLAGMVHGSTYPSFDLDVAYSRDQANLERLATALGELRVTLTNAPADLPFQIDAQTLEIGANFTFDTPHGRFDVLGDAGGVRFDELRASAVEGVIEGVAVPTASIDHLIAMKRAANRPKDRLMLEEYIVIADEQRAAGETQSS